MHGADCRDNSLFIVLGLVDGGDNRLLLLLGQVAGEHMNGDVRRLVDNYI